MTNIATAIGFPSVLFCTACAVSMFFTLLAIPVAIILLLDIFARFKDYSNLRKTMTENNMYYKFRTHRHSACQRLASIAAAESLGLEWRGVYKLMGYRWYHIFPDKTFTKDTPFLKKRFYEKLIKGT